MFNETTSESAPIVDYPCFNGQFFRYYLGPIELNSIVAWKRRLYLVLDYNKASDTIICFEVDLSGSGDWIEQTEAEQ